MVDSDDDTPVANDAAGAGAPGRVAPSFGQLGGPEATAPASGLEPVPGQPHPTDWQSPPAPGAAATPPLDAWLADQAHPALVALLRRPAVAEALVSSIDDADDRIQVRQTEHYPWRCICALTITAADGSGWRGSGWLAGPRTVITAGHCLYLHRHGGWARAIEVAPGQSGGARPYGASLATSLRSVVGWVQHRRQSANYGAIILPADSALGNLLGYLGFVSLSDQELRGLRLNVAGYPSDRADATQWYQRRALDAASPRSLIYPADAPGGPSGAPIWYVRDGQRYVVGVHTHADGSPAIRITPPVFRNLSAWQREGDAGDAPVD